MIGLCWSTMDWFLRLCCYLSNVWYRFSILQEIGNGQQYNCRGTFVCGQTSFLWWSYSTHLMDQSVPILLGHYQRKSTEKNCLFCGLLHLFNTLNIDLYFCLLANCLINYVQLSKWSLASVYEHLPLLRSGIINFNLFWQLCESGIWV